MIVVLAGRRIDAPGAPERFPLRNCDAVRERLSAAFAGRGALALVASAACGADLLAHQAARTLGMRSRVVLPFGRSRFRATCVVDRPGSWGGIFDEVCDAAETAGDLRVATGGGDEEAAYRETNEALLEDAEAVARSVRPPASVLAVVVWDTGPRGHGDISAHFAGRARPPLPRPRHEAGGGEGARRIVFTRVPVGQRRSKKEPFKVRRQRTPPAGSRSPGSTSSRDDLARPDGHPRCDGPSTPRPSPGWVPRRPSPGPVITSGEPSLRLHPSAPERS